MNKAGKKREKIPSELITERIAELGDWRGAALFNTGLDGNVRRAIDLHEGEEIDESVFKSLIRAAGKRNAAGKKKS